VAPVLIQRGDYRVLPYACCLVPEGPCDPTSVRVTPGRNRPCPDRPHRRTARVVSARVPAGAVSDEL